MTSAKALHVFACAGEVNGEVVDLRTVLEDDCELNILTARDEKGLCSSPSYSISCNGTGCTESVSGGKGCHRTIH